MKRIGIIGGMSYGSTLHYYEQINRKVNERAGGLVSADMVLRSVNFEEYHELMRFENWPAIASKLRDEALNLVLQNKCDYIAIASNTMHKIAHYIVGPHKVSEVIVTGANEVWPSFDKEIELPLIHIGDCIAEKCKEIDAKHVLILGTKFTMSKAFLRKRLKKHKVYAMSTYNYPEEVEEINRIIFDELCHGIVATESKEFLMNFVHQFPCDSDKRPDAVVLGCTELNMILGPDDVDIPVIDSIQAHIDKLVNLCLED